MLIVGEHGLGKSAIVAEAVARARKAGFKIALATATATQQSYGTVTKAFHELGLALEPAGRTPGKIEALLLASATGFRLYAGGRAVEVSYPAAAAPAGPLPETSDESRMPSEVERAAGELMRAAPGKRATIDAGEYRIAATRGENFAAAGIVRHPPTEADFLDLEVVLDVAERRFLGAPRPGAGERDQWLEEELNSLLLRREMTGPQDLLRQARRLLKLGSYRNPILIAIDGIDLADPASRRLLGFIARSADETRVVILASAAPGQAEREFAAAAELAPIALEPLTVRDLAALSEAVFGRVVAGARFFERLHSVSGGTPARVQQWLVHLSKIGALRETRDHWVEVSPVEWGTPPAVQQSLVSPLVDLPRQQREVLDAASIVGAEFTVTPVAVLNSRSVKETEAALAALEARDILDFDGIGYAFRDPAMREALRELVPETRRREMSRKLAEFLAGTDGDDEQVALHYWEARDPSAIPRLERIVRRAISRDEIEQAHEHATRLAALLPAGREWEGEAILAEVLERRGGFVEAGERYLKASRSAGSRRIPLMLDAARSFEKARSNEKAMKIATTVLRETQDEGERAAAQLLRINGLQDAGLADEARAALDEAERVFEARKDIGMLCRVSHSRGLAHFRAGEAEAALERFVRARQYALAAGSHDDAAKACNNLAIVYRMLGDTPKAFAMQWEAVRAFQRTGDLASAAACYHNLASFYMDAGDFGSAAASFRQSLELCELAGVPGREAVPLSGLAELEHARGNLREALAHTKRGLELRERLGWNDLIPDELANYSMLLVDLGDAEGAVEAAERAVKMERRLSPMVAAPELALGAARLARGDAKGAEEMVRKALDAALKSKVIDMEYQSRLHLAESLLAAGRPEEARSHAEQAVELLKDAGHRATLPWAHRVAGLAKLACGDAEGAWKSMEMALDMAEEIGMRLEQGRCERDLSQVDLRLGRGAQARERLVSAQKLFDELGAGADLEKAEEMVSRLEGFAAEASVK
jgi:tetratricopeptide (TPR) repeat protein